MNRYDFGAQINGSVNVVSRVWSSILRFRYCFCLQNLNMSTKNNKRQRTPSQKYGEKSKLHDLSHYVHNCSLFRLPREFLETAHGKKHCKAKSAAMPILLSRALFILARFPIRVGLQYHQKTGNQHHFNLCYLMLC